MESMLVLQIILTGTGATLVMDLWSLFQKYILTFPPLNYALVGRWAGWLTKGKWRHQTIITSPAIPGEASLGWLFHYLTGILFAAVPYLLAGEAWYREPSLSMGLLSGLLTLAAPFLILQPVMGFGIAASRTPRPGLAHMLSVLTHLTYGCGLYLAARFWAFYF